MKLKRFCLILAVVAISTMLLAGSRNPCKAQMRQPLMAKLLARRTVDGKDNYTEATYSFRYGINGDAGLSYTHNYWDILFGNQYVYVGKEAIRDTFTVFIGDWDFSRIKDLGELNWSDDIKLPELPAYEKPTREPAVAAVVGHMYLVHTKQSQWDDDPKRTNNARIYWDYYTLFRVESLEAGASVTISWKLISGIKKIPVGDPKPSSDSTKSKP